MNRKLLILTLPLLGAALSSCASDRFGEVEGRVVLLGETLERGSLDLQSIGAGHVLMATDPGKRYAAAAEVVAELQREAHRFYQGRRDVTARADELTKSLAAGGAATATCLSQVEAIRKDMQAERADLDEFGETIKTRIQLVSATLKELVQARDPGKGAKAGETLDELFARLEGEFPHWKSDIAGIRKDHEDQIVSLTSGCEPGDGGGCDPLALLDPTRSVKRLESFHELAQKLENDWGKEIAAELRAYITRHPEGLLLDVVTVSSNHAQVLRALRTKLGWVETALEELAPAS